MQQLSDGTLIQSYRDSNNVLREAVIQREFIPMTFQMTPNGRVYQTVEHGNVPKVVG
jgi:hypothetical protein